MGADDTDRDSGTVDGARTGFGAERILPESPRGKEVYDAQEACALAGGVGAGERGCAGGSRGSALRQPSDPARADPVRSRGPGVRALPARVLRLSPDVLPALPH